MTEKIVITFGTFDLLHKGHINILERASKFGNKLIVGISTDELNYKKKKKNPIYNQYDRQKLINSIKCVSETFFEESLEKKREYILKYKADFLVMGNDWEGRFNEFNDICQVIYLERTRDISTTEILDDVIQRNLVNYICLSEGDAKNLYTLFGDLIESLIKYNVLYFGIGGTLLGCVRNQGLIPWCVDIDIGVFGADIDILECEMFLNEIENKGIVLVKKEIGYVFTRSCYFINVYLFNYINDEMVTFENALAKKLWPNKIILKEDLFPLKEYVFGPLKINGIKNPHNFFILSEFGENYMTEGIITQSYYSRKHSVMVNFLIDKGLNVIKVPELLFKTFNTTG